VIAWSAGGGRIARIRTAPTPSVRNVKRSAKRKRSFSAARRSFMTADDQPSVSLREEPDEILYVALAFPGRLLRQLSDEDAKRVIYLELERAYHLLLAAL
jgi:hypothetical protein